MKKCYGKWEKCPEEIPMGFGLDGERLWDIRCPFKFDCYLNREDIELKLLEGT